MRPPEPSRPWFRAAPKTKPRKPIRSTALPYSSRSHALICREGDQPSRAILRRTKLEI